MLINVSTLLTEPVGRARHYALEDERVFVPEAGFEQFVTGDVQLIRSDRGVLVMASLRLRAVPLQCARCLEPYDESAVTVEFDEEFVLDVDPETGQRIERDEDEFRIDARRHLDLSEAVRQYEESVLPIRPLCRPDCRGLCPTCGRNLNQGACECPPASSDHRWSALSSLAEQLRTEETDGRPEA
jgi:uncharacterized protein